MNHLICPNCHSELYASECYESYKEGDIHYSEHSIICSQENNKHCPFEITYTFSFNKIKNPDFIDQTLDNKWSNFIQHNSINNPKELNNCYCCGSKAEIYFNSCIEYYGICESSVDISCSKNIEDDCPVNLTIHFDSNIDFSLENFIKDLWNELNDRKNIKTKL